MRVDTIQFRERPDRYRYVVGEFSQFLTGSILDVGCDKAVLRSMLPEVNYTGVDASGNPDLRLNLEQIERLPFDDGSFDCVVCLDALEHLDNLHFVFGELVRVSRQYMVISLPNNWSNARRPIERGRGSFGHYGLPVEPPGDRHKWFFGFTEARDFLEGQAKKYPISLVEARAVERPRIWLLRLLRRLRYLSQDRYLNRYAHTLCVVLEKNRPG